MSVHAGGYSIKGLHRFGAIGRVLAKHGFGDIADRILPGGRGKGAPSEPRSRLGYPSPVRIRWALEELGPSFIKLGQLLSVRADVLPPGYTEEFRKLQDQVPPVAFEAIREVVETELGKPLDRLFSEFDEVCMAAASVAQVHAGRLIGGEKVAVKVIRPGIARKIADDIRVMYTVAERFEKIFEIGRIIGMVNLVKEFERTIFQELDMFIEGGNMEKFAAHFEEDDEIYTAKVFWSHTSRSVLTMEYIDGIKMDRVDAIRAAGIDPKAVAMIGLRSFSRQLMDFGFFHADPHPGNTLVMYDGRVSLVDFGITGHLDEETMMQIAHIFLGYAEHDYDMVIQAFKDAGLVDERRIDMREFRADLKDVSEPFYGRALSTISVKDVYDQVMRLAFKYGIRLPRNLLLLLKTFVQTEALGKILGSEASLLEVTRPYAKRLLQRGYDAQNLMRNLGKELKALSGYLRAMPRFTHDILKRTAEGRHRMEVRHTGFSRMVRKMERGLNRFIVGMIISASTIAGSLILNSSIQVMNVTFAGHTVAVTTLLGITGYTIATVLGLWLVISIFRSGKM